MGNRLRKLGWGLVLSGIEAGRYRIGITTSHWIDVLEGTTVINSISHEGRSGCAPLHKVVEFELPANRTLTLQLSGQEAAVVGLIVIAD